MRRSFIRFDDMTDDGAVDRRQDRARRSSRLDARSRVRRRNRRARLVNQRRKRGPIAKLHAFRIGALRQINLARQRKTRMTRAIWRAERFIRVRDERALRRLGIGGARDERGVGAVLDQAPHEIGEKIAVRTDRRIDSNCGVAHFRQQLVERLAHAVQALKLEVAPRARHRQNGGDATSVMRGDLREETRLFEEPRRAGVKIEIGHRLAREHGIIGKTALLGALDFAVPIGALDETHHEATMVRFRERGDIVDRGHRALQIGLHREPESVPAGKRRVFDDACEHVQRKFESIRLLRIDGENEIALFGEARQVEQPRRQFPQYAFARNRLIARMQRRELDRNSGAHREAGASGRVADGANGVGVGLKIALGVFRRPRAFAKHVIREALASSLAPV